MNLQPSTSTLYNDRRALFAWELSYGGHGQTYLSGAGTYTPASGYVFYAISFLEDSTISSVGFRSTLDGETIYQATSANYVGADFPSGYTWMAPLTSITLSSGSAIAYQYKLFPAESIYCATCA